MLFHRLRFHGRFRHGLRRRQKGLVHMDRMVIGVAVDCGGWMHRCAQQAGLSVR